MITSGASLGSNSVFGSTLPPAGWGIPYFIDFTILGNGALPSPWETAATWSIASGVALNTPVPVTEKLTDPGLEANYTAGKCDTLTKAGLPTLAQSADVHGGTKAQQFTAVAVANSLRWAAAAGVNRQWYRYSIWGKRTAGASGTAGLVVFQANSYFRAITAAAYTQSIITDVSMGTGNIFVYAARETGASGFDTLIVDDGSKMLLTFSELYDLLPATEADVIIKAAWSAADGAKNGIVARYVDTSNFILAVMYADGVNVNFELWECFGGTYTRLIDMTSVTYVAGAYLELRLNGAAVSMWYNNTQVSTNKTASNTTGTQHGLFGTGGASSVQRFFIGAYANLAEYGASFMGSSITEPATVGGLDSYRLRVFKYLDANLPQYHWNNYPGGVSGKTTWNNLIRLSSDCTGKSPAPLLVMLDMANDANDNLSTSSEEAWIRRVWAAIPTAKLIFLLPPKVTDIADDASINTPVNATELQNSRTLCAYYSIPYIDMQALLQAEIAAGHHLTDYMTDTIHWNSGGHLLAYNNLLPLITSLSGNQPSPLPAWLHDSDYGETPVSTNGVNNAGETGTWTTVGNGRRSSTAGSTISFVGTFKSFGIDQNGGAGAWQYSVDGGVYSGTYNGTYTNGLEIGNRVAHTITIKVISGTVTVDKFWAI